MRETKRVEDFLKTYHARFPGCTSACVKGARGEDGLSSYEVLAERAGASGKVLDLACGDGFLLSVVKERKPGARLVGIDMSEAGFLSFQQDLAGRFEPMLAEGRVTVSPRMLLFPCRKNP